MEKITMNARKATIIAAVLSFGLFTLEETALAQNGCKQVKAQKIAAFDGVGTTNGTITNGGDLNGTSREVFFGGALPTADPSTITFTADLTITTNHGELKASNVYLSNFDAGIGTVLGRINPTISTGKFAGATGVLYAATKVTGFSPQTTFQEEITGEICFAK
jgi:hypothetical protein